MPLLKSCLAFLVLLTLNTAVMADNNIPALMELSGLNSQIDNVPEQIQAGMQQPNTLPADVRLSLQQAMADSFAPDKLKSSVQQHLQQQLSPGDVNAVMAWLNSPLGKKITALETASATPQAQAEMQNMLPTLLEDTERFALIRTLDSAVNASAATVNMLLAIQEAMLRGMMAAAPASQRLDDSEIQQLLAGVAPQIKSQYELLVIASMAYTYRSLDAAEIHQYIDFANTPAGKNYHRATMDSLSVAMGNASANVGKMLGSLLADKKKGA